MNGRDLGLLGIFFIVFLAFASGQARASAISPNGFVFDVVNTTVPSSLAIAYSTSSAAVLTVIPANEFSAYSNGSQTSPVYNKTVTGQAIGIVNVSEGSYYVLLFSQNGEGNGTIGVVAAPIGKGKLIHISSNYSYPIVLSNFSLMNISMISTYSVNVTFPDGTVAQTNATSQLWYINSYDNGQYALNISPIYPTTLFFYINATPELVDPLNSSLNNFTVPYPIGIASYGLNSSAGVLKPYYVSTEEVEGQANITSISAYNATPPINVSKYGASLQLNVQMNILSGNHTYVYWLQNVMDMDTKNKTLSYVDNIWNDSTPMANVTNATIAGEGNFSISNGTVLNYTINQSIYTFATNSSNYTYPTHFNPIIRLDYKNGYPIVRFGFYNSSGLHYYDNITFFIPSTNASIVITPFKQAPSGNFYDSEFVFGGESSGEITSFNGINASLAMYYSSSNGTLISFPSFYTFGSDTEEAATGIKTVGNDNRLQVVEGSPNYGTILYPSGKTTIEQNITVPRSDNNITAIATKPNGNSMLLNEIGDIVVISVIIICAVGIYRARREAKKTDTKQQN